MNILRQEFLIGELDGNCICFHALDFLNPVESDCFYLELTIDEIIDFKSGNFGGIVVAKDTIHKLAMMGRLEATAKTNKPTGGPLCTVENRESVPIPQKENK